MAGAVIIGAGPGIGRAVARRFAREGLPVGLVARNEGALRDEARRSRPAERTWSRDRRTRPTRSRCAPRSTRSPGKHGAPDVVVYNAALIRPDGPGDLSVQGHMEAWAVNVAGAVVAAAHVAPAMAERGRGTFLITGGMPEPKRQYVSLSLGKAGVRTLVELLHQEYGPSGVHVASVTVAGTVAPGTDFDPDDIAEHYWRLHTQERDEWEREAYHGP
ncbi:SDR family NAD(P)-dependent oxidoreductase [Actinomadura madurae]|uniref:SDR family NAD(P)-dependent oxidoreductase n=1 Tax=Actinomadura madurae TaxID=1993 RepID=UPI0020D22024|nr:SDR family NAD(P)-dependent oxidoreductase [Actinomadura madurae]MCP9981068.1 SDR family NAD(P)-dependent oxidoreductase [Actinomadura madurae]